MHPFTRITFASLLSLASGLGCSSTATVSESGDAIQGASRVAFNIESPSHLQIVGDELVFATVTTSGADAKGEVWAKALAGGERRKLAELPGAVSSLAVARRQAFVIAPGVDATASSSVTKIDLRTARSAPAYESERLFPDLQLSRPTAVAAHENTIYVGHDDGAIVAFDVSESGVISNARVVVRGGYGEFGESAVHYMAPSSNRLYFGNAEVDGRGQEILRIFSAAIGARETSPTALGDFNRASTEMPLAVLGGRLFVAAAPLYESQDRLYAFTDDPSFAVGVEVLDEVDTLVLQADREKGLVFTDRSPASPSFSYRVRFASSDALDSRPVAPVDIVHLEASSPRDSKWPGSFVLGERSLFISMLTEYGSDEILEIPRSEFAR